MSKILILIEMNHFANWQTICQLANGSFRSYLAIRNEKIEKQQDAALIEPEFFVFLKKIDTCGTYRIW